MRPLLSFTLVAVSSLAMHIATAQDAPVIRWQPAFGVHTSKVNTPLILVLLTNDDGISSADPKAEPSPAWCHKLLERNIRKLASNRPFLLNRITFQSAMVGLPAVLTGGSQSQTPRRAVLIVADREYRFLGMAVGVPGPDGLAKLVNHADDVLLLRKQFKQSPADERAGVFEHYGEELDRGWTAARKAALAEKGDFVGNQKALSEEQLSNQLRGLIAALNPTYLNDVSSRFGLTDPSDEIRLRILEQHVETRQPWCHCISAFLYDMEIRKHWVPLLEATWGGPVVPPGISAEEMVAFWRKLPDDQPLTLVLAASSVNPQVEQLQVKVDPEPGSWDELKSLVASGQHRFVSANQLAYLIRAEGLAPVNLETPYRTRFLFYKNKLKQPVLIGQAEQSVGKLIRVIREAQK